MNNENLVKINPDMLVLGRHLRRKTQKELSSITKIQQGTISKIELGIIKETSKQNLEKISSVLKLPKTFFYRELPCIYIGSTLHRKRLSLKKKELDFIDSLVKRYALNILKLFEPISIENNLPCFPIDNYKSPTEVAQLVKQQWQIPDGPIENMIHTVEKNGCLVIYLDIDDEKFDGLSIKVQDSFIKGENAYPLIFINKNMPPDRIRFSIAHELGHLVMHSIPSPSCEEEANEFASEFLMPGNIIKKELKELDIPKAIALKTKWKVSIQALVYRAWDLKKITSAKKETLFRYLSYQGMRKNEPLLDLKPETPLLLKKVLELYKREQRLSYEIFTKMLDYYTKEEFCTAYNILPQEDQSISKPKIQKNRKNLYLVDNN